MKYKWIHLINYIGIYNGMGLNEIKIDFTKCKTNKIIIRGDNGSGKSSLMDAINILSDPNDKFIPNMEARKSLCVIDNDIEYIIRYIHPVTNSGARGTTKAYISKTINGNTVELNPNGNVTSCKDIIYDEFSLDSNFIQLSQLSSEDKGLVQMTPAVRKKFINSIINVLDTYNNIYKTLNKKSSIFKATINSLTYKIDSIGDENTLNLNITAIENRIKSLEADKAKAIETIATLKVQYSDIEEILNSKNYNDIVAELDSVTRELKSLEKSIGKSLEQLRIESITFLKDNYKTISDNIIQADAELDALKMQIPTMMAEREAEFKKLQEKQEKLNSLQSEYNYLDIKNAREELMSRIAEYENIFKEMHLSNINIITKDEFEAAMESIQYLLSMATALTSSYDVGLLDRVLKERKYLKEKRSSMQSTKEKLDALYDQLIAINMEIIHIESKRESISELSNRPKDCKIDTCPYIKNALDIDKQFPESVYMSKLDQKYAIEKEYDALDSLLNDIQTGNDILNQIESIERELKSKAKFILKLPVRSDFIESFMFRVINLDPFNDIKDLYKYTDCGNMIEEYKMAVETLSKYDAEFKIYESKNEIIESIIKDVSDLTIKVDQLAESIDLVNGKILVLENNLVNFKLIRDKIESLMTKVDSEYYPLLEKQNELESSKNLLNDNVEKMKSIQSNLDQLYLAMGCIDHDLQVNTDEKEKLKHSALLLKQYKEELAEYNSKYTKIEKIKYYSSPSTGIQTLFMELYMNKIISIANNLLSYLFNGEFTIQPFIINENEFRIPCMGSGLMHDDISSMSTAQKSMISMILSFALLYQSSTKFNIIKLDEVDGSLDTFNRGYFTTLLDELMKLLKCEQCFIVSHNNELNTYMSDLIVLKNSNEIYSGNIIWKF